MEKEIPNPYVKQFIEKYHPTEEQLKEMQIEIDYPYPGFDSEEYYYALAVEYLTDILKDYDQADIVRKEWRKKYPNQDPPYDGPEYLA